MSRHDPSFWAKHVYRIHFHLPEKERKRLTWWRNESLLSLLEARWREKPEASLIEHKQTHTARYMCHIVLCHVISIFQPKSPVDCAWVAQRRPSASFPSHCRWWPPKGLWVNASQTVLLILEFSYLETRNSTRCPEFEPQPITHMHLKWFFTMMSPSLLFPHPDPTHPTVPVSNWDWISTSFRKKAARSKSS